MTRPQARLRTRLKSTISSDSGDDLIPAYHHAELESFSPNERAHGLPQRDIIFNKSNFQYKHTRKHTMLTNITVSLSYPDKQNKGVGGLLRINFNYQESIYHNSTCGIQTLQRRNLMKQSPTSVLKRWSPTSVDQAEIRHRVNT